MKHKNLSIDNFRGIQHLEIEGLSDVNLFLGINNSSKTSVLEALFLLVGSLNPSNLLKINLFRKLRFNQEEDFRLVFNKLKYDESIVIKSSANGDNYKILEIRPNTLNGRMSSEEELNKETLENLDYDSLPTEQLVNELVLLSKYKERHKKERIFEGKLIFRNNDFITEIPKFKNIPYERAVFVDQGLNLTSNLDKELEEIMITKKVDEVISVLKIVDADINDITFGLNRLIYLDVGMDRMLPLNLIGDGVRRMLMVILSLYNAKGGIVVIDEIENGLHFGVLKGLWKAVLHTASKLNVQLFITTHNYETINYLRESLLEKESSKFQEKTKVFTIRKLKDGTHKSYKYDFSQLENALSEEFELR